MNLRQIGVDPNAGPLMVHTLSNAFSRGTTSGWQWGIVLEHDWNLVVSNRHTCPRQGAWNINLCSCHVHAFPMGLFTMFKESVP